jgi:tripartite-type tricarboxylate transporter receptor subunit TctC
MRTSTRSHWRRSALVAGALACGAALSPAAAQPSKPVTLVVGFAAGAANDVLARTLATAVKDDLGAVIVDNRPGASGNIAAEYVKRAAPDGQTLLVAPNQYVILAAMDPKVPYDFARDFEPIILTNNLPFFLVVNQAAMPAKSLAEVVKLVRAAPGKYSYGSAGNGSPHHFAAEMLKLQAGLDMVHVPYKGMAQGIPDLMEGRIHLVITGLPAVAGQLQSGKLAVLATSAAKRSSLRPDAPTFAEGGVPGVEMDVWQGILAPARTPKATIDRLNAAFGRALQSADVRAKLASQGIDPTGGTPEAFAKVIADDLARYKKVVAAAKIKPD